VSVPLNLKRQVSLSPRQWAILQAAADALIPPSGPNPAPSALPSYDRWLQCALNARSDLGHQLVAVLDGMDAGSIEANLRRLDAIDPTAFAAIAVVVAGAYTMHPDVLRHIGYPGQHRNPAAFDEAANELSTGILDPVLELPPVIRQVPD
jgi:hypothetical protein